LTGVIPERPRPFVPDARRRTGLRACTTARSAQKSFIPNGRGVTAPQTRFRIIGTSFLAGPEHDREDDQPQLVDQVVLDQRAPELVAGVDDDVPG